MPYLLKRFLFRTHWVLGLLAGLVLAVVGMTGALLSYEKELLAWLNPQWRLEADGRASLTPDAVIAKILQAHPDLTLRSFGAQSDPSAPFELRLARGAERGGLQVFVDPYSGVDLGEPRGAGFFHTTEELHRFLAAGPVGKQIVGASTVALIVLAISGVILRWPKRWRSPRAWLTLDTKLRGRSLLWHLHAVVGTWALLFYLLAAATGLWWSYEFYRNAVNALAGVPAQVPPRGGPPTQSAAPAPPPSIDLAHAAFRAAVPDALRYSVAFGPAPGAPLEWRYFTADSAHDRAADTLRMNAADGRVIARQAYAELPRGRRFVAAMFPLHTGSWFGTPGRIAMALASLAMPLFAVTGIWLWLQRRRRDALARRAQLPLVPASIGGETAVDIWHAGQSGTAERLAWRTAHWLRDIGLQARVFPLALWRPATAGGPALFVLATYGDGGPPDSALGFTRRWWTREQAPNLTALECGVLALGNRRYEDFCGFGKRFAHWLGHGGARLWFDRVDSHEGDTAALHQWREGLARRWPALDEVDADANSAPMPAFEPWQLRRRRHLNPQSEAAMLCELELAPPPGSAASWRPGDTLDLQLDDAEPRRYSIASLSERGVVRLLVRRWHGPDGRPGRVSEALCQVLNQGTRIAARVHASAGFAPPELNVRVILIANGVGIAPFLGLIEQRRQASAPTWLIYGERDPATDAALAPELEAAHADGVLERLDLCWSRAAERTYVQDRLRQQLERLGDWLRQGAVLMVCGSPEMGAAVEQLLLDVLGDDAVEALRHAGRYRRELF